jgi:hypothetical protein
VSGSTFSVILAAGLRSLSLDGSFASRLLSSSVLSSLSSQGFGSGVESLHQSAVGERVLLLLGVQNAVASNLS